MVFFGLQIVTRDAQALHKGWPVADPNLVQAELAVFGTYVTVAIAQLALAPQTFLNYCLVCSIEDLVDDLMIDEALRTVADDDPNTKSVAPLDKEDNDSLKAVNATSS
jgi:hypothetical protein